MMWHLMAPVLFNEYFLPENQLIIIIPAKNAAELSQTYSINPTRGKIADVVIATIMTTDNAILNNG